MRKIKLVSIFLILIMILGVSPVQAVTNDCNKGAIKEKSIKIGKGKYKLDGILTLPSKGQDVPVVILVQGSGQSNMDEAIPPSEINTPFKDIAQGLAERGIASIRFNKRYYQYKDTATKYITVEDEVTNDVNYAINFAKKQDRIDEDKIYIVGHSLGGMLGPKIAKDNEEVAGIISLAGSPRKLEDIMADQLKVIYANLPDAQKEEVFKAIDENVAMVKNLKEGDENLYPFGTSSYYWASLNKIDTPEIAKELNIPMFFMQGDADLQVYPDVDFKMWQDILKGKRNVSFKLYPGLNHIFMKDTELNGEPYGKKDNVDISVISDMANWINKMD